MINIEVASDIEETEFAEFRLTTPPEGFVLPDHIGGLAGNQVVFTYLFRQNEPRAQDYRTLLVRRAEGLYCVHSDAAFPDHLFLIRRDALTNEHFEVIG